MPGNKCPDRKVMVRAMRTIQLFSERNMTTRQLAWELEISKQMAARWINAASIVMPITEVGTLREFEKGPEATVYGLMRN